MKIEFTDLKNPNDKWVEEYEHISNITDEILEDCTYKIIFKCNGCQKEIKTIDIADATLEICKKCQKSMDNNIEKGGEKDV